MLEGLDKIDWSKYPHHIYSHQKSTDIPRWIHDLLSDDEDTREEASFDLMGEGQDFGTVTDATQHFIPFLVELLSVKTYEAKWEILYFLGEVVKNGLKSDEDMAKWQSFPQYAQWQKKKNCLEVIRQYTKIYRTLMNDEHEWVGKFSRRLVHLLETGEDTL